MHDVAMTNEVLNLVARQTLAPMPQTIERSIKAHCKKINNKFFCFFEDVPNLCDILPLNKTMNPFLFGVFSGRDATGTRCEGGAFAVLSPVCIVGDPVDKLRIQSRKQGGLRQTP